MAVRLTGAEGPTGASACAARRADGFAGALRRAEARAADGKASDRQTAARQTAARTTPADRGERGVTTAQGRRAAPGEAPGRAAARPVPGSEGGTLPGAVTGAAGPPAGGAAQALLQPAAPSPAGAVALALLARAVVPAVEVFRRSGREVLTLDFGAALGVEVRAAPGGVALTLAAAPGLEASARAELPSLARALLARGVAVVRAEVRPRHGERERGRGR